MPAQQTDSSGAQNERRGIDEHRRLRILCLTLHTPLPADNGSIIRAMGLVRALAARHDVELVCIRRASTDESHVRRLSAWLDGRLELFGAPPPPASGLPAKLKRWTRAVVAGEPPWVREHWSTEIAAFLARREDVYDAVVFLDNQTMVYTHVFPHRAAMVADVHNVTGWSVLPMLASERRTVGGAARRRLVTALTQRSERRLMSAMDGLIVTSREEAERLTALYGIPPSAVVPSAIDLPPEPLRSAQSKTIGWLGELGYWPNSDGLLRFMSEAWPLPDAAGCRLLIAGANPPAAVRRLGEREDVEVLGYVPDLAEFLARVDVAVVPLWAGAGVKLKTITFMGAGIPVVSTSVGVEGTGIVDGVHALIRETPADLASGLRQLLDSEPLAQRLAADGRAFVAERMTWPSVGDDFVDAVERIEAVASTRVV